MHLKEINIYPIKSLKGIRLRESMVEAEGLRHDRRWMLVDRNWSFFTQREFPVMATISVEVANDGLQVTSKSAGQIRIPFEPDRGERGTATVWRSVVRAVAYTGEVSEWFSDAIGTRCMLVKMEKGARREVNPEYAVRPGEDSVSFADGYPFLLIGLASLEELNERLRGEHEDAGKMPAVQFEPLPMNRFRPNFVVGGTEAFAEDEWLEVRVGEAVFHVVKPCDRCVITTVDQAAGEKTGKEPLATLAKFREVDGKILFGQNLIAERPGGSVRVGDPIEVIRRRTS